MNSAHKIKLLGLSNVTDEQLYFIDNGQNWCSRYSLQHIRSILSDNRKGESHIIDNVRVNVMIAQSPEFQNAFKSAATSRMNAQKKCTLWKCEYP